MTREITHMRAFTLALESMGKPVFSIGRIAPTPKLGGPWNEGGAWEFVESAIV